MLKGLEKLEYRGYDSAGIALLREDGVHVFKEKGRIVFPNERPGLGIEIDEGEAKKHPFQQEELQRTFYRDGSVGDW